MWRTAYYCAECDGELTRHQKMYSDGRCPLCGHKGKYAGTIVNTTEKAYRLVRVAPWWKFWIKRFKREFAST